MPTNGREPMTHEIVRNVHLLTTRLAKHKDNNERAKAERRQNEITVLDEVLAALPPDLFDMLGEKVDHLSIALRDGRELFLLRPLRCVICERNMGHNAPTVRPGDDPVFGRHTLMPGAGVAWGLRSGGSSMPGADTATVLDNFTLAEVISGLVGALAGRIEDRHETGRKLTRTNRRLRGILSILDNS